MFAYLYELFYFILHFHQNHRYYFYLHFPPSIFPVTLDCFPSNFGVLLKSSSISRHFNFEWPNQCEGLLLSLKHFFEDTQNGFFLSSRLLGFNHSILFQCIWNFQSHQSWFPPVIFLFILSSSLVFLRLICFF